MKPKNNKSLKEQDNNEFQSLTPEERKKILDDEVISLKHKPLEYTSKIAVGPHKNKKLGKDVIQYRITIPKEFAELILMTSENSEEFEAFFQCVNLGDQTNPTYKLTAEIKRKEKTK